MFTVKATHRGQVRKYTFPKNTFPTYDEICVQVRIHRLTSFRTVALT